MDEQQKTPYPQHPESYFHFHHFCSAMRAMDRFYKARKKQDSDYAIGLVRGEVGYVISHVAPDHFLMPEVYAFRGKAEYLGKKYQEAMVSLTKALQLDPNHVGAYMTLADLYLDTNQKGKVVEAIQAGLTVEPGNKGLRRRAKEHGVAIPELPVEAVKPVEPGKPESTTVQPETPAAVTESVNQDEPSPVPKTTELEKSDSQKASDQTAPPPARIGSPHNPWCRFCTDE